MGVDGEEADNHDSTLHWEEGITPKHTKLSIERRESIRGPEPRKIPSPAATMDGGALSSPRCTKKGKRESQAYTKRGGRGWGRQI